MQTLRRTIHPQVRVLDRKAGLVEYVASDESLDSYNEVILAAGWRFDQFGKNAPFVDSHNYDSIEHLLGVVTDFRVEKRQLIETVKWAIDVPQNILAQRGFAMTDAGYLKAVSVGFLPVRSVAKWDSDKSAWLAALATVGMHEEDGVRCIYLEQQQKELSACVIGANPNAVAKAYRDGIFQDSDVTTFKRPFPELARTLEQVADPVRQRTYSFAPSTTSPARADAPTAVKAMLHALNTGTATPPNHTEQTDTTMKQNFLNDFSRLTGKTKSAFSDLETARRSSSPGDLTTAIHRLALCLVQEKRLAGGDPAKRLAADPERRLLWSALAKHFGGGGLIGAEKEILKAKSLDTSTALGTGTIPQDEVREVLNTALEYGAYSTLSVQYIQSGKSKAAKITAIPDAVFIMPSATGSSRAITPDSSLTGDNLTGECNSVACLLEPSYELMADARVDLGVVFLLLVSQAIAKRLDYGCFAADGTSDTTNGGQTGMFSDAGIDLVNASPGNVTVAQLQAGDFLRAVGAVAPAALQRPCQFWMSPAFLPDLMLLKDGANYLVKSPAETGGDWQLCRFPLTLTAAGLSTNTPGSKVALFGRNASYLVTMREELEITASNSAKWSQAIRSIRAIVRARCDMQNADDFAVLKLAAQ